MHRGDNARSAKAHTTIANKIEKKWAAKLGGDLTQPLLVGSKVYVGQTEDHTVYALDAKDGSVDWSFTAGGRIDSAPTYYEGTLLFGSADGWVYCLRADDGQLAWRRLVAPGQRMVVSFEQVESAWPVHGSVLVQNDTLHVAAGRNSYLDGGISLKRLHPKTGEELSNTSVCHLDPQTNQQTVGERSFDMKGVRPDILVGDGETVFMKHFAFDRDGQELETTKPHLLAINSLLESEWFVRSCWMINTTTGAGWGRWASGASGVPSGRILAFDGDDYYGYGRKKVASAATGHRADAYALWRQGKPA
jgi:outer membrane protein assembly factor BamB